MPVGKRLFSTKVVYNFYMRTHGLAVFFYYCTQAVVKTLVEVVRNRHTLDPSFTCFPLVCVDRYHLGMYTRLIQDQTSSNALVEVLVLARHFLNFRRGQSYDHCIYSANVK
jgi:hypothetical protein